MEIDDAYVDSVDKMVSTIFAIHICKCIALDQKYRKRNAILIGIKTAIAIGICIAKFTTVPIL